MMAVLAPAHLEDLQKKSGLSDETIARLGYASVRPEELKHLRGVESAYTVPYFNVDGSVNCASRLKLFPPITTPDGHTQKYYQAPGSPPSLYLPPLLDWQAIASDPTRSIIMVEGEKKAAAGCQHGLVCAGVAGTWNWRQKLDQGERITLPILDQIIWTGRRVFLLPDSDGWREGKERSILSGFFSLAHELVSRGAIVSFIRLPDLHGVKCGLDDWLLEPGNDVVHSWEKLERIALDDPRFNDLTAWWQKWREKQATQAAIQQQTLDDLTIEEIAGLYTIHSATHAVRMSFDRLTDARGGVTAEITITLGATEVLSGVDVALKSDTSQTKLASSLKALTPTIPWKFLLQRACSVVLKRHRDGEPLRILTVETPIEPLTFQINPLVFRGKVTVLFGDGGLGKSSLALLCAMLVSTGETVAGIAALPGIPLYLDYEDSYDVHVRRMQAIAAYHPTVAKADVRYQACTEPLSTLTHTLLRRIQAEGITFLVLDSLAAATGGDAGAEAATKVFRALRTLNVGALVIAHVPKSPGEGQEPSIYGSVFHKNFARATWEIRKEQEIGSDQSILGIFNRKSNLSRLHHPIGLKVTQDADNTRMQYETFDLSQAGELATALPLPNRIRNLLESDGMPRPSKEIADELGAALPTVKAVLSKHKGFKWHMIGEGREAKWTVLNR
jgi:hypothetical protein